ncbi:hypothetical protein BC629DRAFT_1505860 [Irpex lacteus]|nr:hypothetical protein BC629DRAFT_1505860 [Irpex lacteus]
MSAAACSLAVGPAGAPHRGYEGLPRQQSPLSLAWHHLRVLRIYFQVSYRPGRNVRAQLPRIQYQGYHIRATIRCPLTNYPTVFYGGVWTVINSNYCIATSRRVHTKYGDKLLRQWLLSRCSASAAIPSGSHSCSRPASPGLGKCPRHETIHRSVGDISPDHCAP